MQEETLYEVRRLEGEGLLGVPAPTIAVAKGHLAILERDQALVTNGDAVGVSAEISQYVCRAGHGRLAVDDPVLGRGLFQEQTSK